MDILKNILLKIKKAEENKEYLSYTESITVFKALKRISIEKPIIEKIIGLIYYTKENTLKIKSLSRRESEIFKLIGLGFSSREISDMLTIKEATVSTHRKHIIKKLGLSGSGQLHKTAFQHLHTKV